MPVQPLIMPKLGAYTEDILLVEWLVGEGALVEAGEGVFELETDKTTAEVAADEGGYVHRLVAAGAKVSIGAAVALVAGTPEEYEALLAGKGEQPGSNGRTDAGAPRSEGAQPGQPLLVSPRARALLVRLGYTIEDAAAITGSGPGGRIVDRDVSAWAEARPRPGSVDAATPSAAPAVASTIPLRGRRGTIARRMVASLQTAAQLTSVLELDVKPLVELRAQLNDAGASPRIGITSIVVKLAAAALREHPLLNSRVTETEVELLADFNVAVAIDTPDGLVAPVVHGADRRSLEDVNARIAELARRTRDAALRPDDVAGGTFTVSNGGIHPVDITTAILNPPQAAILWIGRVRDRPVVVGDGAIAVRPTLQACLTFDHRAIDGAPAAAFLGTLESLVADLPRLPA